MLIWCCLAVVRFDVISSAPSAEPLTGLLHTDPGIENTVLIALLYRPVPTGRLAFSLAFDAHRR